MELDPHLAYSIRSRGESRVWGEEGGALNLLTELLSLSLCSRCGFLAGGELAAVALREGCGHHGMLLCLLHCQLHGPELQPAQAAGETLGGQDGVKAR